MSQLDPSTYSMWSTFRDCRKRAYWRYVRELAPIMKALALSFGNAMHNGLESWHGSRDLVAALARIDEDFPKFASDPDQRKGWHLGHAMLTAYARQYPTEPFEVIALEKTFEAPITNPETGAASRSFVIRGKVDGLIRMKDTGAIWLLEHKTTSRIDQGYLERLWSDLQIILYSHFIEVSEGIKVAGVLYNILVKAKLEQRQGEAEDQFQVRYVELCAANKSGKSSAKRQLPESDEEFRQRLHEKYAEPSMFHRERILLSRDSFTELQAELWELTQAWLDARRRDVWYKNTSQCFQIGRTCPYVALCRSGGAQHVIDAFYEHRPAHEELATKTGPLEEPVF